MKTNFQDLKMKEEQKQIIQLKLNSALHLFSSATLHLSETNTFMVEKLPSSNNKSG